MIQGEDFCYLVRNTEYEISPQGFTPNPKGYWFVMVTRKSLIQYPIYPKNTFIGIVVFIEGYGEVSREDILKTAEDSNYKIKANGQYIKIRREEVLSPDICFGFEKIYDTLEELLEDRVDIFL